MDLGIKLAGSKRELGLKAKGKLAVEREIRYAEGPLQTREV
jgi:hypothetical protein